MIGEARLEWTVDDVEGCFDDLERETGKIDRAKRIFITDKALEAAHEKAEVAAEEVYRQVYIEAYAKAWREGVAEALKG